MQFLCVPETAKFGSAEVGIEPADTPGANHGVLSDVVIGDA